MRGNRFILAGGIVLVVAGMVLVFAQVHAQRLRVRSGSIQKGASKNVTQPQPKLAQPALFRPADIGSDNAVFPVTVDSDLNLDATAQALYQRMAAMLTGYPTVPNDRTNYFSAVLNNPAFDIAWWGGTIENVQAVAGGHVVTVGVYPVFSNRATILSPNDYTEQYLVGNDNSITYQGAADPNGYAGQVPSYIEL